MRTDRLGVPRNAAQLRRSALHRAAQPATSPALAEIQRSVLTEIHEALTEAFTISTAGAATAVDCRSAARIAVAAVDGLALHAVSSGEWISARQLTAALDLMLDALVPDPAAMHRYS